VQGEARWKTPEQPRAASASAAPSRRSQRKMLRRPSPAPAASARRWSVSALSSAHHRANDNLRIAGEPPVFSARRRRGELRKAKPGSAARLTGVEDAGADGVAAVEEAADER